MRKKKRKKSNRRKKSLKLTVIRRRPRRSLMLRGDSVNWFRCRCRHNSSWSRQPRTRPLKRLLLPRRPQVTRSMSWISRLRITLTSMIS